MNENRYVKAEEIEINVKELVLNIFQKWKFILLCMVLGAVTLMARKAIRPNGESVIIKQPTAADEYSLEGDYQKELTLYKDAISNYGKAISNGSNNALVSEENISLIKAMQGVNNADRVYFEESILMNLPESGVYCASVSVFLEVTNKVSAADNGGDGVLSALNQMYRKHLSNPKTYEDYSEQIGKEPKYIAELISVNEGEYIKQANEEGNESESGKETISSHWLNIKAYQSNEEDAEELLNYAIEQVEAYYAEIEGRVPSHSISVLERNVELNQDHTLFQKRQQLQNKIMIFDALTARFNEYQQLASGRNPETGETYASGGIALSQLVKHGLIGLALGFVFGFVVLFLYYSLAGIVYARDEVNQMYGMRLLATFPKRKRGKELRGLSKWLEGKKESALTREMTRDQRYDLAAINLKAIVKGYDAESRGNKLTGPELPLVVVTGISTANTLSEVEGQLQRRIPEMNFISLYNPLTNAEEAGVLGRCKGVVLATELNVKRQAVENVVEVINNFNIPIFGTMML